MVTSTSLPRKRTRSIRHEAWWPCSLSFTEHTRAFVSPSRVMACVGLRRGPYADVRRRVSGPSTSRRRLHADCLPHQADCLPHQVSGPSTSRRRPSCVGAIGSSCTCTSMCPRCERMRPRCRDCLSHQADCLPHQVREDATTPETIREIIRRSQPGARILRFNISGGELKKWTEEALREL